MKKTIAFLAAFVMALSVVSISFALVSQPDQIQPFLGVWTRLTEDNHRIMVVIGKNEALGHFTALRVEFADNVSSCTEFSLTYDEELQCLYLTKSPESVTVRCKVEDGNLLIYHVFNNTEVVYQKLEN